MPYSDNNPERRNLTILSLAIIVFYIGGGDITGNTINLPLVNICFNNKAALIILIWCMLGWFLFRYIVTNRHTYGKTLDEHKSFTNMNYPFVVNHLSKQVGGRNLKKVAIFRDINENWKILIGRENYNIFGFKGYLIIKLYFLKVFFKHRATSDYYTPYILFFIATLFGLYNFVTITPELIKYATNTILSLIIVALLYLTVK